MIADEQEERGLARELARAADGMAVAERCGLLDELDAPGVRPGGGGKRGLIPGADDDADLVDAGLEDFLDDDLQRGLGRAVAINQALQGEGALGFPGGGDDGFFDFHEDCLC